MVPTNVSRRLMTTLSFTATPVRGSCFAVASQLSKYASHWLSELQSRSRETNTARPPELADTGTDVGVLGRTRCLVPSFNGAFLSHDSRDALWDKFYTAEGEVTLPINKSSNS
jgi:hypothetical protein